VVRAVADPDGMLLAVVRSTYEAVAELVEWAAAPEVWRW
jgi:hypothetical protein